ncbi:unnamed protein product [Chironomus riparius]|uniref:Chitin-binding type-2 domain-containing protein n=1 Tax=Chironomus riparius TaxID=315576 RepID=A0A9N9WWC3_9DIPT|nr:unnamed protein product [Chironomus riparius]
MKFTFCFILLQIVVKANADVDHSVCSGIINGRIPHPDPQNCGLYIFCMMTFANVRSCPPNTVFVPHFNSSYREGECEPGNAETCEVWTTTTIPETSTAIYTTTELDDPTLTTENEYDTTIPDATTDLPTNESTTTEKPLTTTSRLPTTTPIPVHRCPPSGFGVILLQFIAQINGQDVGPSFCTDRGHSTGVYPHPTNCTLFVLCIFSMPFVQECEEYSVFVPYPQENPGDDPFGRCQPAYPGTCDMLTTLTVIHTTTEFDDPTLTTENEYDTTIPDATTDLPTNESTTTEKPLTTTSRLPTTTPIPVHRCPPSGFGYIPHHTNCNRYFECIRGVRHLRFCYEGFLFDSVTLKCTYPELAICAGINGQVIEQNFCIDQGVGSGLFPHPDPLKCNSFVLCAMLIPIPQVCPTGKIFDPYPDSSPPYGSCQIGNADTCELFTTTTTTYNSSTLAYTTTESDVTTTINDYTADSTIIPEVPTFMSTNQPTTTFKLPTTTPIPVHRCPSSGFGYIPHHTNCSRYFECIAGKKHLRFCPYGLLFDSVTLQCTYSELAVCAGI